MWDAAVALSEGRTLGVCKKCDKELQYRIDHIHANDPDATVHSFTVTRAVRLGARLSDGEDYDAFLLVLREPETGKERILPAFWTRGQANALRGGQFLPPLPLEQWKTLFRQLDGVSRDLEEKIRLRAYQLFEQRGRRHGHALEDWLQAQAELIERKALRAAA
jgi:hypothetical protein